MKAPSGAGRWRSNRVRKPKDKRKKENSPAVLNALQYSAQFNPRTAAVQFPLPTGEQIDLFMKMTDGEQREYFRVGRKLLEEQRRQACHARRSKGKAAVSSKDVRTSSEE